MSDVGIRSRPRARTPADRGPGQSEPGQRPRAGGLAGAGQARGAAEPETPRGHPARFSDDPPKPEAARPRSAHNQPPEPIDREKPTIDLKKRPDDQPKHKATQADQPRAEHGHFAPREQQVRKRLPGKMRQLRQPHARLPDDTPYREPPPRLHERAKADWHATPESVRGDIHRAQSEFQQAYQKHKRRHRYDEHHSPVP